MISVLRRASQLALCLSVSVGALGAVADSAQALVYCQKNKIVNRLVQKQGAEPG